jgi:hypothetical protein
MNLEYQRAGRVLPFPFTFLNNNHAMNVRPVNYGWREFYDRLVDLTRYSFSWRAIGRRLTATASMIPKWMNVVRAMSSEGWGRIEYHTTIRRLLDEDRGVRAFLEGESRQLPDFYAQRIKSDLGALHAHLPPGGMMHDPNAYLKSSAEAVAAPKVKLARRPMRVTEAARDSAASEARASLSPGPAGG